MISSKDRFSGYNQTLTKEHHMKFKQIFDTLEQDPQSYDFLEPVDYVGKNIYLKLALGLDDYPKIILNPMDVSTVKVFSL
jgi:hypothetical protein